MKNLYNKKGKMMRGVDHQIIDKLYEETQAISKNINHNRVAVIPISRIPKVACIFLCSVQETIVRHFA